MSDSQTILVALVTAVAAPLIIGLIYWLLRPRIWIRIRSSQPVTVAPGTRVDVVFHVRRWRYSGRLLVHIDGLPSGLSAESIEIPYGGEDGKITLAASAGTLPDSIRVVKVVAGAETVHATAPLQVQLFRSPVKTPEEGGGKQPEPKDLDKPRITLTLQRAYFEGGFFNVPVEYQARFGAHDEDIELLCGGAQEPIVGRIDRNANPNHTPRIRGRKMLRDWFHEYTVMLQEVTITVLSPTKIRIDP